MAVNTMRILVADDNVDAADSLAMLLQFLGYDVHVAYDGAQAVKLAHDWEPRMVILDINMPVMDGYQAARALRQTKGDRLILVALTAAVNVETEDKALTAGFDVHLSKPLDDISALERLLQHADPLVQSKESAC